MMNEQKEKSMFTVETKSMLAKLMATENITVEHRNCKTAGFNLKTRTLICPIWKEMDGDLYDLLMGHEISHALRTPMAGWHDSVMYAGGDKKASPAAQKAFKHFLNVAEDARIEKLIKRQYPGLRRPMINGYKSLLARDFFGLSAISNFNDLYLIDKLNLAAKCGSLVNIRFNAKEQPFYDEMMKLETWEEVVALARKLYAYSKQEQKEGEQKKKELADHLKEMNQGNEDEEDQEEGEDGEGEEGEWDGDEDYDEEEGEGRERQEGDSDDLDSDSDSDSDSDEGENSDKESKSDKSKDGDEEDGEKDEKSSKAKGDKADKDKEEKADDKTTEEKADDGDGKRAKKNDKKSKGQTGTNTGEGQTETEEFIPKSKTDEAYREAEKQLVENDNQESYYINIPTANLKDIVAPAAVVNKGLNLAFGSKRELGFRLLNEFKKKNEDYISLLAKEFEMKKAARSYAKAKISDTGDININKLANYKLEDNIFKKLMVVHKGKSHGLVLILDKSGSMSDHIEGAMEQILVMALFCRKVNIPFVAYSFTSTSGAAKEHDFPGRNRYAKNPLKPFSTNPGDLMMGELDLREMFNSKMPAGEFVQAIMNHLMVAKAMKDRYALTLPNHERMGSTPLNEALVALRDIIRDFKKVHRLDIVNAVVVHDGDSNGNREAYSADNATANRYYRQVFIPEHNRVTLIDAKEKLRVILPKDCRGVTIGLMKWLQMTANCGVFGFYITGATPKSARNGITNLYQNKQGIKILHQGRYNIDADQMILMDKLCRQVIDEKFLESYTDGYTRFYFIPGSTELSIPSTAIQDTGKAWTPSRLLSAFKKVSKKKQVSRVLVNKFIELMAV